MSQTILQQLASRRNWNKARIKGCIANLKLLTEDFRTNKIWEPIFIDMEKSILEENDNSWNQKTKTIL